MANEPKKAGAARKKRSDAKDLVLVGTRIEPWQNAALLAIASERARRAGKAVSDKSEIVREALELHPEIKKRRK